MEDLYAFSYIPIEESAEKAQDVNDCFKAPWDSDYCRMGLPNEMWVKTEINSSYKICDTYPEILYVPKRATVPVLIGSSSFRSKGRLPVLSYYHRISGASICRCSQPLAGFSARCLEDEQLLQTISSSNDSTEKPLYLIDTRPRINAVANKAAGKGFENENFYSNIKFHFFSIENIHVVRSSMAKLLEACWQQSAEAFYSGVERSGWLKHICAILEAASFIMQSVSRGISCMVHCSDGWDRTPQTISTASLLLDPFYRSIRGFRILIEKDWLAFGHKFTERCGMIRAEKESNEQSPIFTQFLDCVWQIMSQFPSAFEFNEAFLLCLHEHVHAGQFGTFLGNCEKDRTDLKLAERTRSFWAYVCEHEAEFKSPRYEPIDGTLTLDLKPQLIRFWSSMYNQFDRLSPQESLSELLLVLSDEVQHLKLHSTCLEQCINYIKDERRPDCDMNCKLNSLTLEQCLDSGVFDRMEGLADPAVLNSIAVCWQSLRKARECSSKDCDAYFTTYRKHFCSCCGLSFCQRCANQKARLRGLATSEEVFVCNMCFEKIL